MPRSGHPIRIVTMLNLRSLGPGVPEAGYFGAATDG